jgi:hypothetical protein
VTIAAGYHCWEGIVLCADTEETVQEYIKHDVQKILRYPTAWDYTPNMPCALFAGAGDGALIESLSMKMGQAMERLPNPTLDDIVQGFEDILIKEYQKLVLAYQKGDMPQADFLIAIRSALKGDLELIHVTGPIIERQVPLRAIGYGVTLYTYLASRLLYPKTSLQYTMNVMTYMLDQVKTHVAYCGGGTQMYTLNNAGECTWHFPAEVEAKSKAVRAADNMARNIAGAAMNPAIAEESLRKLTNHYLSEYSEEIKRIAPQTVEKEVRKPKQRRVSKKQP